MSRIVTQTMESVRENGLSVHEMSPSVHEMGPSVRKKGSNVREMSPSVREISSSVVLARDYVRHFVESSFYMSRMNVYNIFN